MMTTLRFLPPLCLGAIVLWLAAAPGVPAQEPADSSPLSLGTAVARAQAYSPLLQAVDLDRQAVGSRLDQAGRRPNPTLSLEGENLAGSGDYAGLSNSEWVLALSQEFDLSGKRRSLQEAIGAESEVLLGETRSLNLDLARETGLAFGEVWSAQSTLDLAREKRDLALELEKEIALRLERGGSSALDLSRAQVGTASAEIELFHASQTLETARRRLAGLWGENLPGFTAVTIPDGFWDSPGTDPQKAVLDGNPDLTHWDTTARLQELRMAAARAAAGTDLELSLGLKLDNASGDEALVVGGALPLPVSDRNQDEIRALGYEKERQLRLKQESANRLAADLAAALAEQATARREMDILAKQIIPLATRAYTDARHAHQRGLYSLTDVLETRRHLFELRENEVQVRHRFFSASIQIARLTGQDPAEVLTTLQEEKP